MKALLFLTVAVLMAIGTGVGVVALDEEPTYQLGTHAFKARLPIPLSSFGSTQGPQAFDVHGLDSPPEFRVGLAYVARRIPTKFDVNRHNPMSGLMIVPAEHLRGGSLLEIPDAPSSGHWALTKVNGFFRNVDIFEIGHGYWNGHETAFNDRTGFTVSATSTSIGQVRAFLDSFVPIR